MVGLVYRLKTASFSLYRLTRQAQIPELWSMVISSLLQGVIGANQAVITQHEATISGLNSSIATMTATTEALKTSLSEVTSQKTQLESELRTTQVGIYILFKWNSSRRNVLPPPGILIYTVDHR